MSNIVDYQSVPEVISPNYSVEYLRDFAEAQFDKEIMDSEQAILSELVHETQRLLSDNDCIKKSARTVGNTMLSPRLNCTDYTRLELELCSSIEMDGIALFREGHASVIVPSDKSPEFWLIDGFMGTKVKFNSMLHPFPEDDEVTNIKNVIEGISTHKGAYIYRDGDKKVWKHSYFDSDEIRKSSPYNENPGLRSSIVHSAGILVTGNLAHRMLSAIDILETLRINRAHASVADEYTIAKASLKRYVPKLSNLH